MLIMYGTIGISTVLLRAHCLSRCLFCHNPTHLDCFLIAQQLWLSSITKLQASHLSPTGLINCH